MPKYDRVVIGASAGGVETLSQLVKNLPPDLAATICIVIHFPSYGTSVLPTILNRAKRLPASHVCGDTMMQSGHIYIAPPDYHLLMERDRLYLSHGPRENGHRPAIDTLFRSAAYASGQRVIGVLLSGMLDDGVAGLASIQAQGGLVIVQNPQEALFDSMPRHAIERVEVDYVLRVADIAHKLMELAGTPSQEDGMADDPNLKNEGEIVAHEKAASEQGERPDAASMLTCPDCGGVLWEIQEGDRIRFRCHVGHAYSLDSMLAEQANDVERALWSAVRALEEKAALARRMAVHAQQSDRHKSEAQFLERAKEAAMNADLVRKMIMQRGDGQNRSTN